MSIILLENDKRIKNLFNTMFGTINLDNKNDNIINYNKIKFLLSTDEIRTNDMLDEICKVLLSQFSQNEVNNIFINHGIIVNRNNPKFSILSSNNSLARSLEQASFFSDNGIIASQNNLEIIKNNINNENYNFTTGLPYAQNISDYSYIQNSIKTEHLQIPPSFDTYSELLLQNKNKNENKNENINIEFIKPYKNNNYTNLSINNPLPSSNEEKPIIAVSYTHVTLPTIYSV